MLIGDRQWYAAPDDSIESWCFLVIDCECDADGRWVSDWELGWGNSVQLLRRESSSVTSRDEEEELLEELNKVLDSSRYQGVTLVTCDEDVVSLLRTRFVTTCEQSKPTLRGFLHIAVEGIVQQYFSDEICTVPPFSIVSESVHSDSVPDRMNDSRDRIEDLWVVLNAIGPLVPSAVFHGYPL